MEDNDDSKIIATRLKELVDEVEATNQTYYSLWVHGVHEMVLDKYGSLDSNMRKRMVCFITMLAGAADSGIVTLTVSDDLKLNGPFGCVSFEINDVDTFYNRCFNTVMYRQHLWRAPVIGTDITERLFSFCASHGYKPLGRTLTVNGQYVGGNAMCYKSFKYIETQDHHERRVRRKRAQHDAAGAVGGAVEAASPGAAAAPADVELIEKSVEIVEIEASATSFTRASATSSTLNCRDYGLTSVFDGNHGDLNGMIFVPDKTGPDENTHAWLVNQAKQPP